MGWQYQLGGSDINDVTGDHPTVQGYELGHLELDLLVNLASVPFNRMKGFIKESYQKGGVVTISWHPFYLVGRSMNCKEIETVVLERSGEGRPVQCQVKTQK